MRWCRRSKRMKVKLLKSTRCNRLYLHHSSFSQHLSPLQFQAQPQPSVLSQQSLPSTHRGPDVLGPAAPMTQEYVPHGGAPPPPMTPNACLQEGMARVPIAPTSPPDYHGGMQFVFACVYAFESLQVPRTTIDPFPRRHAMGVKRDQKFDQTSTFNCRA